MDDIISPSVRHFNRIQCTLVDARHPFPSLGTLEFDAVPSAGDIIHLKMSDENYALFKITIVRFEPGKEVQVKLGVLPANTEDPAPPNYDTELKQKQEEIQKSNLQIFDRAQAYTNAMIVAGFAGVLTLWNFSRATLTERTTDTVALMLSISLICFVSNEIYAMLSNASEAHKFNRLVDTTPQEFFKRWDEFQRRRRQVNKRHLSVWRITFFPTVFLAYGAGLLMVYNFIANLLGLPRWP